MKAVVTGMIATYPLGGVVWDYAQYALGLEQLGFEVYYLEDTGEYAYDPRQGTHTEDDSYGLDFLGRELARLSSTLGRRWHVRSWDGRTSGIEPAELDQVVAEADLFLNVSGSCLLRPSYLRSRRKVLIDTDPGRNHFVDYPCWDRGEHSPDYHGFRSHDHFFTYALNLRQRDCVLPTFGLPWQPTVPPVVLDCWRPSPSGGRWTTVMTWDNFRRPIEHDGVSYGSKEREFCRLEDLPRQVPWSLEVAVGGEHAPRDRWIQRGWSVLDSHAVSTTADAYRSYIQQSRGELSVAKHIYAATRSGWFSCRTVCYLAAGRPAVVQDTGFARHLPTGEGLLAFETADDAARALEAVERDYGRHQQAARALAESHFAAPIVLADILARIGLY